MNQHVCNHCGFVFEEGASLLDGVYCPHCSSQNSHPALSGVLLSGEKSAPLSRPATQSDYAEIREDILGLS
ncbi:MAG: hypothetical protein WCL61_00420 [bacterium]